MEDQHDPLGVIALTAEIRQLRTAMEGLMEKANPYADLIPETEFSERLKISRSTLRNLLADGTLKKSWVKTGKYIFWSPRLFREELLANTYF